MTDLDLAHLRAAIALSESAVAHGNHPFGAVLADPAGVLVLEAENTVCALRVDQVDHVASLVETEGSVIDASGRALVLLDPLKLTRRALELIAIEA